MFKKLRNRLIFINLGITTVVIAAVFSTIYILSTRTAENRRPLPMSMSVDFYSDEMADIVEVSIKNEKAEAAKNLLTLLIISGVAIELAVLLISYFLAEEAIKPVKNAYEAQRIFIANASHEIKTPLAAISANLEAADIQNNRWIKNVELETAKLSAINSELLTLARTDLVTTTATTETDLKNLITKTLDSFKPRLKTQKLTIKINLPPKVKVNAPDFTQIVSILMDNAIKYSDNLIKVTASPHTFTIENDGKTISPDALPHIFDRFYQQDKSADGVGLGLSIAKSLADRNHWKLSASSGKTTKFTLGF